MRKIEQQMVDAVRGKRDWTGGNTWVSSDGDKSQVFLHNNHIATVHHDTGELDVNRYTLRKWPTNTTKSRLRELGAKIETRKGVIYVNGEAIQ